MELSILERIALLSILPQEGNFVVLKIVNDLRNNLSFSEEEIKKFSIKQENDLVTWDTSILNEKDIQIGEKATDIVVDALKKLNDSGKLTMNHFTLYAKFIG